MHRIIDRFAETRRISGAIGFRVAECRVKMCERLSFWWHVARNGTRRDTPPILIARARKAKRSSGPRKGTIVNETRWPVTLGRCFGRLSR